MHPSSCVGISECQYTASLKALTEYLERRLVCGNLNDFPHSTDGVAGWDVPTPFVQRLADFRAREHALSEACERYIWSHWWDNPIYAQKVLTGSDVLSISTNGTKSIKEFIVSAGSHPVAEACGSGKFVFISNHL